MKSPPHVLVQAPLGRLSSLALLSSPFLRCLQGAELAHSFLGRERRGMETHAGRLDTGTPAFLTVLGSVCPLPWESLTVGVRSRGLEGVARIGSGLSLLTHKMGVLAASTTQSCGGDVMR